MHIKEAINHILTGVPVDSVLGPLLDSTLKGDRENPKVKSVIKLLKAYDVRRYSHWKKAFDLVNRLGPKYDLVFHTCPTSQYAVEWMTVDKSTADGFETWRQLHGRNMPKEELLTADDIEDPSNELREFIQFGISTKGPSGLRSWK